MDKRLCPLCCNDTLHYVNAVTQEQNPFVTAKATEDMRDWLMLAGQCNQAEGKSLLAIMVEPCYSYDAGFQDWKELRIEFTFGPRPSLAQANSQPQLQSPTWDAAAITTLVQSTTQSTVLAAHQAPPAPASSATASTSSVGKGKEYNEYAIAAIMG